MGKLLGGILLIAGTCIGGGMLGLPLATHQGGLIGSTLLFIVCWSLMTFTALLTLEVSLQFSPESNILTIAKNTLGKPAEILCWTVYLCFLYSLVAAYIAGGEDVLHGLLKQVGVHLPNWLCGFLFVFIFGSIVTTGIKQVDLFNRLLMLMKLTSIILLMFLILFHVKIKNYTLGNIHFLLPAISVAITSFGFSIIVPSMRNYFQDALSSLRLAIIFGSTIPLICYIAWNAVIFGLVPLHGQQSLDQLNHANYPITALIGLIYYYIPSQYINILANLFSSICVLTAFACVSLGLFDFLADGLALINKRKNHFILIILTFLPPTIIGTFYPQAFLLFLSVAGLLCVLLQALMPTLMAWQCRYVMTRRHQYEVIGGKPTLILAMLTSLIVIAMSAYQLLWH